LTDQPFLMPVEDVFSYRKRYHQQWRGSRYSRYGC
jgi:hypothetical protein